MPVEVTERITVAARPTTVYEAVSDVHRVARWSPECFAVWVLARRRGSPARFVGFNRRGRFVWFTTCRVRIAAPGEEFAFDVTTFGMPLVGRLGGCAGFTVVGASLREVRQLVRSGMEFHAATDDVDLRESTEGADMATGAR